MTTTLGRRSRLQQHGQVAWAILGIVGLVGIVVLAAKFLAGIIVPTIASLIIAVLVLPLTERLAARMSRGLAVGLTLVLIASVALGLTWMFVAGLVEQVPAISETLRQARSQLEDWLGSSTAGQQVQALLDTGTETSRSVDALQGWVSSALHSVVPLLMGLFIATMVLFLVLLDPAEGGTWFARVMPWAPEQSQRFLTTFGQVIRDYFKGATIMALVNAVPIWIAAQLMGVEGAGAVFVVLFATSYIPYVGAWLGGAFAVLMALGSGGSSEAWIMLAAVLVVNLGLQSIVQPFAFSATLKVSALGVFLFTLVGGAVAGAFGAMLAGPIMAMAARYRPDVLKQPVGDPEGRPLAATAPDR